LLLFPSFWYEIVRFLFIKGATLGADVNYRRRLAGPMWRVVWWT